MAPVRVGRIHDDTLTAVHQAVFDGKVVHEQDGRAGCHLEPLRKRAEQAVVELHAGVLGGAFVRRVESNDRHVRLFRKDAQALTEKV